MLVSLTALTLFAQVNATQTSRLAASLLANASKLITVPYNFAQKRPNLTALTAAVAYKNSNTIVNAVNTLGSKAEQIGNKVSPRATAYAKTGVTFVLDQTGKVIGFTKAAGDKILKHIGTDSNDALNALANGTIAVTSTNCPLVKWFVINDARKNVKQAAVAGATVAVAHSLFTGKPANLSAAVNKGAAAGALISLTTVRNAAQTAGDYVNTLSKGIVSVTIPAQAINQAINSRQASEEVYILEN